MKLDEPEADLALKVADGALFMDAIDPGWYWKVDPDKLDMASAEFNEYSPCGCVLAQHHPDHEYRPDDYGLVKFADGEDLGFSVPFMLNSYPGLIIGWKVLEEAWKEEIYDRRADWLAKHG